MKRPWYPWYPGDWRRETSVQMCSIKTRGIYREILDCMYYSKEQGSLTGFVSDLARLVGCGEAEMDDALNELKRLNVCDISVTHNGRITITNRRMAREAKDREQNRLRQERHRRSRKNNDTSNDGSANKATKALQAKPKITSAEEPRLVEENRFFSVSETDHNRYQEKYLISDKELRREYGQMVIWLEANPKKRKKNYKRFIVNWISRHYQQRKAVHDAKEIVAAAAAKPSIEPKPDKPKTPPKNKDEELAKLAKWRKEHGEA